MDITRKKIGHNLANCAVESYRVLHTEHALYVQLRVKCGFAGKFYTLTTGANERRWEKMKDRLKTVVDSFQIFNV